MKQLSYQMVVNRFIEASPIQEEGVCAGAVYRRVPKYLYLERGMPTNPSLGWKAVQKGKRRRERDSDELILSSLPTLTEGEILPLVDAEITNT